LTFVLPEHHPRLLHLTPYLRGDSLAAIALAGRLRRRGLVWGIDQNAVADVDDVSWITHWPEYRKQYPYVATGEFRGRGALRREVRIPVPSSWPRKLWDLHSHQVERLRSAQVGGRRPRRARVHMLRALERDVPLMIEVKHSPAYRHRAAWVKLAQDRAAVGARRVGIMTLQTQWPDDEACLEVLEHAVEAEFPVALLPRAPRPAGWSRWVMLGVRKWGRWRAVRR